MHDQHDLCHLWEIHDLYEISNPQKIDVKYDALTKYITYLKLVTCVKCMT